MWTVLLLWGLTVLPCATPAPSVPLRPTHPLGHGLRTDGLTGLRRAQEPGEPGQAERASAHLGPGSQLAPRTPGSLPLLPEGSEVSCSQPGAAAHEPAPVALLHVPWTGTRSLRSSLARCLGDSSACSDAPLVPDAPAASSPADCAIVTVSSAAALREALAKTGVRRAVTLLRHPMRRIQSAYRASHPAETPAAPLNASADDAAAIAAAEEQARLSEFAGSVEPNTQGALLAGIPLEAFGVVGTTEQFVGALRVAERALGLPQLRLVVSGEEELPPEELVTTRPVPRGLLLEHAAAHRADIVLHGRAAGLLAKRRSMVNAGAPFAHGVVDSCDGRRTSGWAWWESGEEPVVLLAHCDGAALQMVVADRLRRDILWWNPPRAGRVGFQVACSCAQKVVVKVRKTGQALPVRVS